MAEIMTLAGTMREETGSPEAKRLRRADRIPAVFYKRGEEPIHLAFERKDVEGLLSRNPTIFRITWVDGEESGRECMIRDVQYHPVYHSPLHLDLMGITRGEKIDTTVKIRLEGSPEGVKTGGGILQHIMGEVDIRCLPKDIPETIVVDVTNLALQDSIHLSDIQIEGVEWLTNPERTVATVVPPKLAPLPEEEEEEAELEEGEEEEAKEVEESEPEE